MRGAPAGGIRDNYIPEAGFELGLEEWAGLGPAEQVEGYSRQGE